VAAEALTTVVEADAIGLAWAARFMGLPFRDGVGFATQKNWRFQTLRADKEIENRFIFFSGVVVPDDAIFVFSGAVSISSVFAAI